MLSVGGFLPPIGAARERQELHIKLHFETQLLIVP